MTTQLRTPFPSLSAEQFLSRGSGGQVFVVNRHIVFKCPTLFDNPMPEQREEMEESIERIENEKAVYQNLMNHPHPHIVHGILCVPQGLFMHRLAMTLETRIAGSSPISPSTQRRWIRQLSSAVVWLESLGYVHGDLRPANIFLDSVDDIRLGDFDSTVKRGEQLKVASEPFCKVNEDYELPIGGPISEQFSLGSCIYTIRNGHKPWHNLEAPIRVRKLMKDDFPPTSEDNLFGGVTRRCWFGAYDSISAVEEDILSCLGAFSPLIQKTEKQAQINEDLYSTLQAECKEFLASQTML